MFGAKRKFSDIQPGDYYFLAHLSYQYVWN